MVCAIIPGFEDFTIGLFVYFSVGMVNTDYHRSRFWGFDTALSILERCSVPKNELAVILTALR